MQAFNPQFLSKTINEIPVTYLFNTHSDGNLYVYYKMKEKHNYSFTIDERIFFESLIKQKIVLYLKTNRFEKIVIPQSDNCLLKNILTELAIPFIEITKSSRAIVIAKLEEQKMMRQERKALLNSLTVHNGAVKIATIAANQRLRIAKLLFEAAINHLSITETENVLYIDDSVFTSSTFKAISDKIKISAVFTLFSDEQGE